MNAKQVWQSALERIQPKVSSAIFHTWFDGASAISLKKRLLTVRVRTTAERAQLEDRFHDLICSVLSELIGAGAEVRFEVGSTEEQPEVALSDPSAQTNMAAQVEVLEQPEEENTAEMGRSQRQPAMMTVVAAQRERFEAAQQGRRLSRRPLSYTGPELLTVADERVTAPLLTQINPSSGGRERADVLPAWQASQPSDDHVVITAVESSRPAERSSAEQQREPERAENALMSLIPWTQTAPARGPGNVEGNAGTGQTGSNEGMFNPRYTFSTFIVGRSNQLAHAASQAVADAPGKTYNPLLFYGGVGLGKTHLLHAIGQCGLAAGLNVLYTTSDRFTNEIINAIRFHTTEEFRAKYRQIDILLVDDIQFIAGKESTEEEFFHTFNSLHNANKQIVLTSDRPPKAILALQDRLRSRFEWGLIADIKPPDYEHRLAILRSKTESPFRVDGLHLEIPNNVIEYIATPECASVRELEGSLNLVVAYAKLHHLPVTISLAVQALKELRNERKRRTLEPEEVLEVVARHYNVSLEDLRSPQRNREIVWPRQVAMVLMREETKANLKQVAAQLGRRDHTTVMHAELKMHDLIRSNDRVRKEFAELREELHMLPPKPQEAPGE